MIGVALIVLGLASLPYLIGALAAGPDRIFTGLQVNPLDGVSYLAKMRLGYNGELALSPALHAGTGAGRFPLHVLHRVGTPGADFQACR